MLIHLRRTIKRIIEFLQLHLPGRLVTQSYKAKGFLNCSDSNRSTQKKPPAKVTLSELKAQMEQELQAIE